MSEMDMYGADEEEEQFYEAVKILLMAIQAVVYVLYDLVFSIRGERIRRPLTRRPVTSSGYIYMHKILDKDPQIFREVYRMYPDVFRKLCSILKVKTPLRDTRHICVEEMLATFLLVVGQNNRYSEARLIFERSHFTVSKSFNKVLKALNTIAPEFMAKPESVPPNIRESTRFYPYFKDCVGAIDGTHIPATVVGREVSRYRNRHGKISQNVLAACNFDLQFTYVISGWEGSAHDSKVLNDAISRRNGLKVPPGKYYLGDCGFPNRRRFLAPFRGT
ncbi:putative harbinger transposase-derived nuclease domain-containing protein [Rosa chinensis]|uniref:Putative harbinger transposase-derived nuclease domain-containing protein n=1 Tax=Rosa chinensis TaxID=74649 RepID=A0A2P6PTI3_ROSCH|nr:protein ALP1-like isoform X2 [Rosa chinensis]PRQ25237.1 putative harbinger transposase-derived nuclease domain-containing protein [Rosa chinensis]